MSPRKATALRDGEGSLREHLIATAREILAEDGTVGLTVRAIARRAGVADGVLYNHFADKEELLATALHAHLRTVESGLTTLPEPGVGKLAANLRAHLAHGLALHRAILPAFTGLIGQPAVLSRFGELIGPGPVWRDQLLDYLRAEQRTGRIDQGAATDTVAALLVGICHEQVLAELFPPSAVPATHSPDDVISTLLNGIAVRD